MEIDHNDTFKNLVVTATELMWECQKGGGIKTEIKSKTPKLLYDSPMNKYLQSDLSKVVNSENISTNWLCSIMLTEILLSAFA